MAYSFTNIIESQQQNVLPETNLRVKEKKPIFEVCMHNYKFALFETKFLEFRKKNLSE